ncbi:CopG family transcriptional regulator [Corynebacterium bovis]|uniref:CopG family transcriptional regulator n=1 Tax=Corynebacterium bovis TaxID=36808 RepID=A0A426Q4D5_9CORY|nr:ribbon-helix-helix domain-containing protein [Corynebacterium bovis]RRO92683.1 CopG family transcriptional regulator [Corynebacterium bovis]RRO98623.1 CopG family transcriptional regulator [Corynebacterium bovis]RRO99684.1 CopG family transcriptional regulator [Corynebacterium bovis]RRQ00426.1 CopG family transcriptional regulator [Corynebacterium bovis]RRQ03550.1 CopG family transcriptional regulator [Corynebacterium bovis]
MAHYTLHGTPVTDEQIQAWADEAEAGYDLEALPAPRRGGPPVGEGPGTVVPVRLDQTTLSALLEKAESEGIATRSEAIRAAVRQWTQGPHVA